MDFKTMPDGPVTLTGLIAPACFEGGGEGFVPVTRDLRGGGPGFDMGGAMVLPCGVDMHTHLDKGHIWPRAANPDGSFTGALTTVAADRESRWSAEDVRRRMDFSLRCAFAHGTRAIRTHLDSIPPQDDISWPVFAEMRAEWAGRIDLQAAALVGIEHVNRNGAYAHTADLVRAHDGVLGAVAYPVPDVTERLNIVFEFAEARGLSVDFHVDETLDPDSTCLRKIAEIKIARGFEAPVVVGHCCSLSTQDQAEVDRTLDLVAEAGLNVVSLPMCNLYLQHRRPGLTPRFRGITLVHEMRARGIPVGFASDNTRDPFYAYGDLDMIEVMREATRIGHLDHSRPDWPRAFNAVPEAICRFGPAGPEDFMICKARGWTELFARPQADRIVIRGGAQIDRTLPDYAELDDLMEPA